MRLLVLGGSWFLDRVLLEEALREGHRSPPSAAASPAIQVLRPAADPNAGRATIQARPAGTGHHRRAQGRRLPLAVIRVPVQLHRQPAATVPAGFTQDGLPIGLRIAGRRLDDALVLRASAAYEAAAPWRDRWSPMRTRASTSWMTFSAPTRSLRAGGRGADKPVGGDRDEMVDTIATCCQRINHSDPHGRWPPRRMRIGHARPSSAFLGAREPVIQTDAGTFPAPRTVCCEHDFQHR